MGNRNIGAAVRAIPAIVLAIALATLLISLMAYQQACADRYFAKREAAEACAAAQKAEAWSEVRCEESETLRRLGLAD